MNLSDKDARLKMDKFPRSSAARKFMMQEKHYVIRINKPHLLRSDFSQTLPLH
jgi:hypothetical protein